VFALLGVSVLFYLVRRTDTAKLGAVLERGTWSVPLLVGLEGTRIAVEAWGGRKLYTRRIPYPLLLRATLVSYAVAALVPAGRAAGESVKAGMLRRLTRIEDTAAAATTDQTCSLLALGLWSLVCCVPALPVSRPLAAALATQSALVLTGAALVRGAAETTALGRIVGHFSARLRGTVDAVRQRAHAQRLREPLGAFVVSRGVELIQYAVMLQAVTRHAALVPALLAFGVATLAGSIGDSVPVQLGVIGATFYAAAGPLGISGEAAVAVGLLAHVFQIVWVAIGLLTPLVWRVSLPTPARPRG